MRKIGIISLYYNSYNYGGSLQAYALCMVLNKMGHNAEQICFELNDKDLKISLKQKITNYYKKNGLIKTIFYLIYGFIRKVYNKIFKKNKNIYQDKKNERENIYKNFYNLVPHSSETYSSGDLNIDNSGNYDIYITGSDQVWNTNWYKREFFLNFVPDDKKKLAYAASVGIDDFEEGLKEEIKQYLNRFDAISVREEKAVSILERLDNIKSVVVLDPTLLLQEDEWSEICDNNTQSKKYVFCYFLGTNEDSFKLAKRFAKESGYKLVILVINPSSFSIAKKYDEYLIWDVSVSKFLSLIKHAECIFTDSFHASVFSLIFKKQFIVFNRDKKATMSSRIISLMQLFGTEERYLDTKQKCTIDYIKHIFSGSISYENKEYEKMKEFSLNFLKENIEQI